MNLPFKDGYRITQKFGLNKAYYSKFGLGGHEGIDLVSKSSDWTVHCLYDGVVVRDEDNPKSGSYGIYVTVWHPSLNIATQYCHLQANFTSLNQEVKQGQPLGNMGSTGNSTGAHLHLNVFKTNGDGVRLNRNNGFLGGIDPLPFLEDIVATPAPGTVAVDAKTFEELVQKSTRYDEFVSEGFTKSDDLRKHLEKLDKRVSDLEETNRNLNQLLNEKNNQVSKKDSEISTLTSKVSDLTVRVESLTEQAKRVPELSEENDLLNEKIENYKKSTISLQRQVTRLKNENEALKEGSLKAILISWATSFKNWWHRKEV